MLAKIMTLAGGTVLSQAITFLGIVVAANLLTPVHFGNFGLQLAISTPIAILATGRFEVAYIRANKASRVANLLALASAITVIVAIGATFVLATASVLGSQFSFYDAILIGTLVVAQASVASITELNTYNKSYAVIVFSRVVAAIVTQASTIVWALIDPNPYVLGVSMVLGLLASALVSIAGNRYWLVSVYGYVSLKRMRAMAMRYRSFLFYNAPQSAASALQESFAMTAIASFFGAAALGHYVLLGRLLRGPISIVAESVGRVLQRQAVDLQPSELRGFLRQTFLYLTLVGAAFSLASATALPPIFELVFGESWPLLATLCAASAPYFGAYLVGGSVALIPWATGHYRVSAPIAIVGSLTYPALIFCIAACGMPFIPTIFLTSLVMTVYFAIFILAIYLSSTRGVAR